MRADGIKLKHTAPMYTVAAHIMAKRYDAMNMCDIDIPLEPMEEYLRKKHKEGVDLSHLSLIIAAYIRLIGEFPELNRFIVNKTPYARREICVAMVVLKAGDYGNGTMSKMYFKRENTIFEVNEIIKKYVEANRNTPDENGTEKIISALLSFPGVLRVGVPLLKWLDKHGWLPKSVIDGSPFHNSLVITNLASIRTNSIYHHLYEFGTSSVFLAMGTPHYIPQNKGGEIIHVKTMPVGVVMDERIASGTYFSLAFRRLSQLLRDPSQLEVAPAPESVKYDPAVPEKKRHLLK